VGDQFALLESVVALAKLFQRFDFELVPNQDIGMTTGATIHTKNVRPCTVVCVSGHFVSAPLIGNMGAGILARIQPLWALMRTMAATLTSTA
jgi:hypothetical protein